MGAALCKDQADTRPTQKKLTLWGDYINADTKAILTVLRLCNIDHEYTNIETILEEHKKNEEFQMVTPIQEVPVITEGSYKIISGPQHFMLYLCNTRKQGKDSLYPKDCEKLINRHMAYYENKFRPRTQRLIKIATRQLQDEHNLIPNETPRGQARMSVNSTSSSMAIENEIEQILMLIRELNEQVQQSDFFGS